MTYATRNLRWLLLAAMLCSATAAQAQYRNPSRRSLVGNQNVNRSAYQRPSVSPYLQLLNQNFVDVPQYQTLVRPQIEQQQINRQQERQIQNIQRQVASSALGAVAQPAGPSQIRGTGHPTQYQTLTHRSRDPATNSRSLRPIFLDYSRFYSSLSN